MVAQPVSATGPQGLMPTAKVEPSRLVQEGSGDSMMPRTSRTGRGRALWLIAMEVASPFCTPPQDHRNSWIP